MFSIRDRGSITQWNTGSTLPNVHLRTNGARERSLLRMTRCLIALLSISSATAVAAETDFSVERRAAEAVLKLDGGVVGVSVKGRQIEVRSGGTLPADEFTLIRIDLLKGQGVDDSSLPFVPQLSALRHLNLSNTAISDKFLAGVAKIPTIEVLYLHGTPITDVGLESFTQHKKLDAVFTNNTFITDRGAAALGKIPTIRRIHVVDTKITDAGVAEFAKLPALFDCSLEGTAVTDAGVAKLKACPNLVALRVGRTATTDAGVGFLKGSLKLQVLDAQVTNFSDGILPIMAGCPSLKTLDLRLTKVTEPVAQQLKKSLPSCEVRWSARETAKPAPVAPKPEAVFVDPTKAFITEVATAAEKLLQAEEYEKLDALTEKFRDGKELFPNGTWKLTGLYGFLAKPVGTRSDLQWNALLKRCDEWREARPKSTAAPLVLAIAWRNYGWQARGTGYASTITAADGQLFQERLEKCAEILSASEWTAEKDPEWFRLAVLMQKDHRGTKEQILALCKKSVELHPTFPETLVMAAVSFYPRWGGKPGELEAFARQAVEWTEKTAGKSAYARIAIEAHLLHGFHIAQDLNFSWDTVKQGFEDWQSRFPSDRRLQAYARMACVYRDRSTAARLFESIDGPYDFELWYSQYYVDMMKTWAAPSFENGDQRKVFSPFALSLHGVGWTSGQSATVRALSDGPMLVAIDGERVSLLATEGGKVFDVASTPRGTFGATVDPNSTDIYFSTSNKQIFKAGWTGSRSEQLCDTETAIGGVVLIDQPPVLAVVGEEGTLQLYRASDGRPERKLKLDGHRLTCLDASSKADLLVAGVDDGTLFVHTVKSQTQAEAWKVHDAPVLDVVFSPNGKLLVTCTMKEIKLWNVADRKLLGTLEGPQGTAMFKFTGDGTVLVGAATTPIAGNNYRLAFWNVAERKLLKLAAGHKGRITGLAISPDDKTVATSSADTSIRLWDVPR